MARTNLFISALMVLLLCGCGDDPLAGSGAQSGGATPATAADTAPQVQLMEDMATAMGKFHGISEEINDADSATTAVPKLESLLTELQGLSTKLTQSEFGPGLVKDKRFKAASDEVNRVGLQMGTQAQRLAGIPSVNPVVKPVMLRYGQWAIEMGTQMEAKVADAARAAKAKWGREEVIVKVDNLPSDGFDRLDKYSRTLSRMCGAESRRVQSVGSNATIRLSPVDDFDELLAHIKKTQKVTNVDSKGGVITIDASGGI